MTNLPPDDDLPIIDVRSPGERLTDSGRAGFDRLRASMRDNHFDVAAAAWMVFVLGLTALELYTAFRGNDLGDQQQLTGWDKAAFVAASGGIVLTFGAMIGIALAFAYTTTAMRAALRMALVAGLWAVVANVVGIAVAFHDPSSIGIIVTRGTESKVVQALTAVMEGGFGLIVVAIAAGLLASARARPDQEIGELS